MWNDLLVRILRAGIGPGHLHITLAGGQVLQIGTLDAPPVRLRFHDADLPRKILQNPEVALGEAYTDGDLTIEGDDLKGFLTLALQFRVRPGWNLAGVLMGLNRAKMRLADWNPVARSRANVAHHYDLSQELYTTFLGEHMQYTCAYFRDPEMSLDQAQAAKLAHVGAKLLLRPGMRVLDIGSGFGTLAISLARDFGVRVTGITLSKVQIADAQARARAAGVQDLVEFRLQDYRDVTGTFDRVVSIGMLEHVGRPHLSTYFRKVHDLLRSDGLALIHYIGRPIPPTPISPWFQKYIFPGAYCPSLSEVTPILEKYRLFLCDLEVWRGHYDRTLAAWRAAFEARSLRMQEMTDARFVRMWRYYLVSAEVSFALGLLTVHQFQLARAQNVVPASRDYLYWPSGAARQGSDAGPGDLAQAQGPHQFGKSVDLLGGSGHLEHETFQG